MAGELISNPGASRWITTTPSPGLIRKTTKDKYRQQLLGEAASMLPDEEELTKQILSYKIPYADLAPVANAVRGELGNYLTEYRKNPYYAFTREGIETVKGVQRMVSDPRLKQLESAFDQATKQYEDVRKKELGSNLNYQDGLLTVVSRETGQRERIPVGSFNAEKYHPLAMDEEYAFMTNREGLANRRDPFAFNMNKLEDVKTNIRNHFQNLGSDERDILGEMVKNTVSNNKASVASRKKALVEGFGLSEADWNTLKSEYFTSAWKRTGNIGSERDAEQFVFKYIDDLARGYEETSSEISKSPVLDARVAAGQLKAQENLDLMTASENKYFGSVPVSIIPSESKQGLVMDGYRIAPQMLQKSAGFYEDDKGNKIPRMNVAEMDMFNATDKNNPYIFDRNTGDMKQIQGFENITSDAVLSPKHEPSIVTRFFSTSKNRYLTLEEQNEMQQLANTNDVDNLIGKYGDVKKQRLVHARVMVPAVQGFFSEGSYGQFRDQLRESGYDGSFRTNSNEDWYDKNVQSELSKGRGFNTAWDDFYEVDLFFPYHGSQAGRVATGEKLPAEVDEAHHRTIEKPQTTLNNYLIDETQRTKILKQSGAPGFDWLH